MKIAIFGCGGFGREIAPLARAQAKEVIFVSDLPNEIGREINGVRAVSFDELYGSRRDYQVVIAVADAAARRKIAQRCEEKGLGFATLRAPTHRSYDGVEVGSGSIFCDFTMCTANLRIGKHFHANIYSYVAHDCVIGDFVTLAPKVCINGNTVIEDDVYIGTGAVLKQGTREKPLRIGRGAVIGMGAVVTKDVPAGITVVGNPARELAR